ncbi:hypothetical protein [Flavobacterium sasangense]|uniref:hypothetical protein n=1 Tax=Flavobacterium sasangense TaxID=503361 RepID=UPI00047EA31C|nr:hypothetical protein [Flavobacterium sasangense]
MYYESDILLDDSDDLNIVNGDFVIGESTLQEVGIILRLNSGELRNDPVLAPNLIQLVNSASNDQEFEERVRLFLRRDNKNYEDIKKLINIKKR